MNSVVLIDDIKRLYEQEKYTMQEIADELNVSVGYVHKKIHEIGVIPRPQHTSPKSIIGKPLSVEHKEKLILANKNKKLSAETKEKISKTRELKGIGHKKKRSDGYIAVYFPDHPKSSSYGYIMEHDLIMECLIGRHLKSNECVHHINKIRNDNRKENLKLMTLSEHMSLHSKERNQLKRGNDLSTQ
jgi:hypothetical protein